MSFFCILACTLRHSLSVSPCVSVSKLPIRPYYLLISWRISQYSKKIGWMCGLLNPGSPPLRSVDLLTLFAVRAPHSTLRHPWRDVFFVTHLLKKWDNFRHLPKWFYAKWPNEIAPTRWLKMCQLGDWNCAKSQIYQSFVIKHIKSSQYNTSNLHNKIHQIFIIKNINFS